MESDLEILRNKVKEFMIVRDWDKFHNVKDLFIALVSEIGELAELYRWLNLEDLNKLNSDLEKKKKIEEEIADIMIYLLIISYKSDINIIKSVEEKLEKNNKKYPVDIIKGKTTNPLFGVKVNG